LVCVLQIGRREARQTDQTVDNEIAYHWRQETSAMGKLSTDELEMVYKTGWKPSEYLANK
tara:strand:+ start:239 stop:418 length:180 start_codon:yes stop_codon:yes gene_type:complete